VAGIRSSVSLIWNLRSAACSDEPDHAGLPAAIGQRRVRRLVWLRDHAKQVAAGILKHDEIRTRPVPPGVERRPEVQQPVYLGGLVSRIEIKVDPTTSPRASVSRLKRKIRPLALRITLQSSLLCVGDQRRDRQDDEDHEHE